MTSTHAPTRRAVPRRARADLPRAYASVLVGLVAALLLNSILGPLALGVVSYPITETVENQLIGLELQYVLGPEYSRYSVTVLAQLGIFVLAGGAMLWSWSLARTTPLPPMRAGQATRNGVLLLALAGVMWARNDPNASVSTVLMLSVASVVFGAVAWRTFTPPHHRPTTGRPT